MRKTSALAQLLAHAGAPVSRVPRRLREAPPTVARTLLVELEAVLHLRDGFRAVSGALFMRPSVTVAAVRGVDEWNQITLWRSAYRRAGELLFFAETMMGVQFALYRGEVVEFDPETGNVEHHAFSLERWADRLLAQPEAVSTAEVIAWEGMHGPLGPTDRLQPSVPRMFADGRDVQFGVLSDLELMQRYARLYRTTKDLPAGVEPDLEGWWT